MFYNTNIIELIINREKYEDFPSYKNQVTQKHETR